MGGLFSTMTDKDRKLIAEAERLPCARWYEVADLQEEADTNEAREHLRRIAIKLYHRDEASIGNL